MGYRSSIKAAFYPQKNEDFALIKLWVDEHIMRTQDFWPYRIAKRSGSRFILFEIDDVKWYDNFPEVIAFNNALVEFENMFGDGKDTDAPRAFMEFIRLGEDPIDVEERSSDSFEVLQLVQYVNVDEDVE
jgi:hypothetical protein